MDTYKIRYICWNCGHTFKKRLDKGIRAKGNGGVCPNCGLEDKYFDMSYPYDVEYHNFIEDFIINGLEDK